MSERTIKYESLDSIKTAKKNAKKHDLEAIKNSIRKFGFIETVLVDERTGELLAGHGRIEALKSMKDLFEPRPEGANKHELIIYGWKNKHEWYGEFQTTIIEVDKPQKSDLHPTMKPVELMSKLINNSSLRGQVVLDLFAGSGSTLIAAEQAERICYAMEIEPIYVQTIITRWEMLTGRKAEKI